MQLQFTHEELKLVAQVLEEQSGAGEGRLRMAASALLGRIIEHDLRLAFDELEDLQDILNAYARSLPQRIAQASPPIKQALAKNQQLLEHVMDRVTEASAMV